MMSTRYFWKSKQDEPVDIYIDRKIQKFPRQTILGWRLLQKDKNTDFFWGVKFWILEVVEK